MVFVESEIKNVRKPDFGVRLSKEPLSKPSIRNRNIVQVIRCCSINLVFLLRTVGSSTHLIRSPGITERYPSENVAVLRRSKSKHPTCELKCPTLPLLHACETQPSAREVCSSPCALCSCSCSCRYRSAFGSVSGVLFGWLVMRSRS